MKPATVNTKFLEFCRSHGYSLRNPVSILDSDATVMFVNASMTPFKPVMLASQSVPKTAVVQRCFRNYGGITYLNGFDMLGIVADAPALFGVFTDLLNFLDSIGIGKQYLHMVIDSRDGDLLAAAGEMLPSARIHTQTGDSKRFFTRWKFGHGDALIGRGLTIAGEIPGMDACSDSCGWNCTNCRKFLPLGNIIMVRNSGTGKDYIDAGFGTEVVASFFHRGDIMQTPPFCGYVDVLTPCHGLQNPRLVVRLLLAVRELLAAGLKPGTHKQNYLLRKFMRELFAALNLGADEKKAAAALREMFVRLNSYGAGREWALPELEMGKELRAYVQAVKRGTRGARTFLAKTKCRSAAECRDKIRETYGLPDDIIDQLLTVKFNQGNREGISNEKA